MDWHFGKRYFLSIRSHPFPERNGKIINRFRYPKCALSGFAGEIIFPLSLWKVIRHFTGLVHDRSHQIAVTKPKSYLGLQFHDVAPKGQFMFCFMPFPFLLFLLPCHNIFHHFHLRFLLRTHVSSQNFKQNFRFLR